MNCELIPHGDMPGDSIQITENHIKIANLILPELMQLISELLAKGQQKVVICVCGGSGVGKSETASLLSYLLGEQGLKCYTMSGDNYPHRIPEKNDAERLLVYEAGGVEALKNYLGTPQEINFDQVNQILRDFKAGKPKVVLKRMGRREDELWYDEIDFSDTSVLMLEWTHGNSDYIFGVDIPILLNSTPQETLEHRKSRNRDGAVDSPFTTMVLEIEQAKLKAQAHKAKIIVTKAGELINYNTYCALMNE